MSIFCNDNKTLKIDWIVYIDNGKEKEILGEYIPIKDVDDQIISDFDDMLECISDYILKPEYASYEELENPEIEEYAMTWKLTYSENAYGLEGCVASLRVKDINLLNADRIDPEELERSRKRDSLCKAPTTLAIEFDGEIYYNSLDVYAELYGILHNFRIFGFINSKDIRQYLMEIDYWFSAQEAAWLVYQCKKLTLKEKLDAWQFIIDKIDDGTLIMDCIGDSKVELPDFLPKYVAMKSGWLERFMNPDHAIYYYALRLTDSSGFDEYVDGKFIFASYDECLNAAKRAARDYDDEALEKLMIRIVRMEKEADRRYTDRLWAYHDRNYKITDIEHHSWGGGEYELENVFDKMWFAFPLPFKKGDIIYDVTEYEEWWWPGPIVLEQTAAEFYPPKGEKGALCQRNVGIRILHGSQN